MQFLWIFLVLVAAAINLAPLLGAFAPDRMTALYGVNLDDPNLQILMRHRAVLFGLVGGVLLGAAFHPPLRTLGYTAGFASMLSFLLIAWWMTTLPGFALLIVGVSLSLIGDGLAERR